MSFNWCANAWGCNLHTFSGQHLPEYFGTICWAGSAVKRTETKCTVYCHVSLWGPPALNTLLLSRSSSCSCFLSQRVKRWRWASTTPLQMYWTLSTTPSGSKVGKAPFVCVCGSAFEWERDRRFTRLPMLSTHCSVCGHLNNSGVFFSVWPHWHSFFFYSLDFLKKKLPLRNTVLDKK